MQNDDPVKMVVGKTFDEIVMDETKDVFLFVISTSHFPYSAAVDLTHTWPYLRASYHCYLLGELKWSYQFSGSILSSSTGMVFLAS